MDAMICRIPSQPESFLIFCPNCQKMTFCLANVDSRGWQEEIPVKKDVKKELLECFSTMCWGFRMFLRLKIRIAQQRIVFIITIRLRMIWLEEIYWELSLCIFRLHSDRASSGEQINRPFFHSSKAQFHKGYWEILGLTLRDLRKFSTFLSMKQWTWSNLIWKCRKVISKWWMSGA